jgi:hypothetical protein
MSSKRTFKVIFCFRISQKEEELEVTNCDFKLGGIRKLPYAFTEQGVAMLSSVLNSETAIQVNIQIIRLFTK